MQMTAAYSLLGASDSRYEQLCCIEGLEPVCELARRGKGILLVTFHFGTHLLSLVKLEKLGLRLTTVRPDSMRNIRHEKKRRILFIHNGAIFVGGDRGLASGVREIVRKLRDENFIVGFAPDGDRGEALQWVPLLGGWYPLRRGFVEIAKLARVPMVYAQGFVRDGRYHIRYSPIWDFPPDREPQQVAEEFLKFAVETFEHYIRETPESIWWTKPMEIALGLRPAPLSEGRAEVWGATEIEPLTELHGERENSRDKKYAEEA